MIAKFLSWALVYRSDDGASNWPQTSYLKNVTQFPMTELFSDLFIYIYINLNTVGMCHLTIKR